LSDRRGFGFPAVEAIQPWASPARVAARFSGEDRCTLQWRNEMSILSTNQHSACLPIDPATGIVKGVAAG
jgi:hypothetical protein